MADTEITMADLEAQLDNLGKSIGRVMGENSVLTEACHAIVSALDGEHALADKDDDWIYDTLGSSLSSAYFKARKALEIASES